MSKEFIYELNPTDWFFPFKSLEQAIVDAEKERGFEGPDEFKNAVLNSVDKAKKAFQSHTAWEGDGRFYISGLPGDKSDNMPLILVLAKQYNNGTTFLYSPVELPYLNEFREA